MTGAVYFTVIELGKAAVINHRLRLYVYSSPEVVTERVTSTEVTFSGNRYSQLENLPQQIARTRHQWRWLLVVFNHYGLKLPFQIYTCKNIQKVYF